MPRPGRPGEDIVYSPDKYRETEGIKGLGSNNLELDKYFRNGDFESMFEYAIACTSTENVNEAASFNRFLEAFLTSWKNKKCVEYKGEDYTWPDFVKKVKDEQSNSQQ